MHSESGYKNRAIKMERDRKKYGSKVARGDDNLLQQFEKKLEEKLGAIVDKAPKVNCTCCLFVFNDAQLLYVECVVCIFNAFLMHCQCIIIYIL